MKNKRLLILCLSLLMLVSAVLVPFTARQTPTTSEVRTPSTDQSISPETLAATVQSFITGSPTHTFDLSRNGAVTFSDPLNISYSYNTNGYYTFTARTSDPYVYLAKSVSFSAARYVLIKYRTTVAESNFLQFYIGSSGGGPQDDTTMLQQKVVSDGEWHIAVFDTSSLPPSYYNGSTGTYFRLDPLAGGTVSGDSIDISSVSFYTAASFDYSGYIAYVESTVDNVHWDDPTYVPMTTTSADYNNGTLTYTPSSDGSEMTISYKLNGSTVSNTVPNQNNYLFGGFGGTDDLGRELYSSEDVGVYGSTGEHYVGLFYFLWHGQHGSTDKVYNLQKIIDAGKGQDASQYAIANNGDLHWFAEPLYGYYISGDQWVMRKHAELLCNANVDFLYLDATNAFTYTAQTVSLMTILNELNQQGYDAPQIVFYTNSNSNLTVETLYNEIYARNYYPDTWFRMDGKPVIVATEASDLYRTSGSISATLKNFFYIKESQWPNEAAKTDGWPWMDWNASGPVVYRGSDGRDAINVSIAQHNGNTCFSSSAMYTYTGNRGRSYAPGRYSSMYNYRTTWVSNQNLTKQGINFQWQWDAAINSDAEFVLVTGWNEWVAQRQTDYLADSKYQITFIDCASMEFSRDAEMMAFYDRNGDGKDDGYFDNYYMQLTQNIQRLKGNAPVIVQDSRKPINVTGDFSQWNDITVTYTDMKGDTEDRSSRGYGNVFYTNTTGRNDILATKVTSDTKNVYFYAQTRYDVSMYDTKSSWMQLFVDADNDASTGWYGYDYIVNYRAQDQFTTTVAKYTGTNGQYGFTSIGTVGYRAKNNEFMIAVPQSMLGLDGYLELDFRFKWADSDSNITTMQQFYTDGDAAPLGRLNYIYQNYIPGKSIVTYPSVNEPSTETETSPDTDDTENSAPTYEPPADNSVPVKATANSYQTCTDNVFIDGVSVVATNDPISSFRSSPIVDDNQSIKTIAFYGWTNTGTTNIAAFGYEINGVRVWSDDKINTYTVDNGENNIVTINTVNSANNIAPDSGLSAHYPVAKRHLVEVNVGDLEAGVYNISILIRLTDGTVSYMKTWGTFQFVKWKLVEETKPEDGTETETETDTDTETETDIETPVIEDKFSGASLSVGQSLSLIIYATLPSSLPDDLTWAVQISMNDKLTTIPFSEAVLSDEATNEYAFHFAGITPQCMGDTMTITLVHWDTWGSGVVGTPVSTIEGYSIKTNLTNLLKRYPTNQPLVQLIYDTLHYGAAAQNYTNHQTDALVTADLDSLTSTAVANGWTPTAAYPEESDNAMELSTATSPTRFKSAGILYDQGMNRLYFKYITDNSGTVTMKVNGTVIPATYADGAYSVFTDGIFALQFDEVFTAELYVDDQLVQTLRYSVNTYVYRICTGSESSVDQALALALYRYGVAAEAYRKG